MRLTVPSRAPVNNYDIFKIIAELLEEQVNETKLLRQALVLEGVAADLEEPI